MNCKMCGGPVEDLGYWISKMYEGGASPIHNDPICEKCASLLADMIENWSRLVEENLPFRRSIARARWS